MNEKVTVCERERERDKVGFERKKCPSDVLKTGKCSVKYFYVSNKGATPRLSLIHI